MLSAVTIWNLESDSEAELDIQYHKAVDEDDSSDHSTLQNLKRRAIKLKNISAIKMTPDKLMVTFGDKTTTITETRKQVARKSLAQRTRTTKNTKTTLEHYTRWYYNKLLTNNNYTRHE